MSKFKEEWRGVLGYEGFYSISNLGRVKSLNRVDPLGKNIKEKFMHPSINNKGYMEVSLSKYGASKRFRIHRLIAIAFIPTSDYGLVINHLDGNKINNSIENIEWCTQAENVRHAYRNGYMIAGQNSSAANECRKRAINQYDLSENFIKKYESAAQIRVELGILNANISQCCNGINKTSHNYKWKFA